MKKQSIPRKHKSQFIYSGTHADDNALRLSPDDITRFKTIARFPYLPSNWIHKLIGGSEQRSYT